MKLISLDEVRAAVAESRPEIFYIPEGKVLSPAARDYLNEQCIRVDSEGHRAQNEQKQNSKKYLDHNLTSKTGAPPTGCVGADKRGTGYRTFVDYHTGAVYREKPENMTHVKGNKLVPKDDPIIRYRGKLDETQALVVFVQTQIAKDGGPHGLLQDLDEVLTVLRTLMKCEVLGEPVCVPTILGLDHAALREHSHHASDYYGVPTMTLPSYDKGVPYAGLNLIRTFVRETETLAVAAYESDSQRMDQELIEVLNRLSSALHIMMCKTLGGKY